MKRALMRLAYQAIYATGARLGDGGITILSYHSIDEHGTGISVPPRLFAEQMATLAALHCPTFTMAQVAEHLAARRPFPPRAVAITFDDGFANVGQVGGPILARHGLTATVYIITGMVGRVTRWTAHGAALPALPLLTWEEIRVLGAQGVEMGGHTVSHGFLTQYAPARLRHELEEPRAVLERELGAPAYSFAYPQGDYNAAVVAATQRAGYRTAVTIDQGRAGVTDDPFRLRRLHVGGNTTPTVLRAFVVPTIGPANRAINTVIHGVLGRKTWPRPSPQAIDSTGTLAAQGDASVLM
jgi:peptidoglycan/xylan/chitin deacetylase (PgdA/CDA1 family)